MEMHINKLVAPAVDWKDQTWAERLDHAASLLFCHGYIPLRQREKIARKLEKQFADALAKGDIVMRADQPLPANTECGE